MITTVTNEAEQVEDTAEPTPDSSSIDTSQATSAVDTLLDRAWDLRLSDTEMALSYCEKALKDAQALVYPAGVARSLYTKSWLAVCCSNPQEALVHAHAALPQFEALNDPRGTENTLNALGIIYSELGKLDQALKYFLARYHLCEGRNDESEAEALQNLGYIYDYLGNSADALAYHLKSWKVCTACGDRAVETELLNNIGYSYYRLGQYEDALNHYRKGLTLSKPDSNLYALILDNMALAFEKLGDLQNALTHQQESLTLREAQRDKRGVSYSLDSLGSIHKALGALDRAQGCLEQSLVLKQELGDQKGEAETLLLLGRLLLDREQPARALSLQQRALGAATQSGTQDRLYEAHKALAEAYKREGRLAEALFHFERYSEVKESVINEVSNQTLSSLRVQFETEQAEKEREIYRLKNVELAHANLELQALNDKATNLLAQLERQAKEDALTGLYNRRHADLRLREEFVRARRFEHPLSVALCDIDNFKKINDTFSHHIGDEVLRVVARLFQGHLREVDTAARYGGEEFLLLLPETPVEDAFTVCGDLCRKVAAYPWDTLAHGLRVTLSIGVSNDGRVADHEKLTALADAKLYEAKRGGKNQVRY